MDASQDEYGAELSQLQGGERKVIAFLQKMVPQHKRRWSQLKLEFEAVASNKFQLHYLSAEENDLVQIFCLSI